MVTVVDKDYGYVKFRFNVRELRGREVKIGFWGNDSVEGTAVVDYAVYNEFGTSRIPSRPFMQTTADQNREEINAFVQFMVGKIIDGDSTPDHALQVMGAEYQKRMQMTIRNAKQWAVPNAESTVKAKGSSSPLIDTGRMLNSVRYQVT